MGFIINPYRFISYTTGVLATVGGTGSHNSSITGQVFTGTKITGLIGNNPFTSVGINFFANAGNVRVKVYADDGVGNAPGALLAESGSTLIAGTGFQDIPITGNIPANGIVYIAFEVNNAVSSVYENNSGTQYNAFHTYGAGPSPFGSTSTSADSWNMRISN